MVKAMSYRNSDFSSALCTLLRIFDLLFWDWPPKFGSSRNFSIL